MTIPISSADFETLINHSMPSSLSLYMPTHRAGTETQQNAIRFKNLLARAEEKFIESGLRRPEAEARLRPLHAYLGDGRFWQNQLDGLVLFFGLAEPLLFRLPLRLPEMVNVGSHFYLKPLLPLLGRNVYFYILALSQGSVRLFEAGRFHVIELTPADMPRKAEDVIELYETERIQQWHSATPPTGPKPGTAMFHGQGVGTDARTEKKRLAEFCSQVQNAVRKFLENSQAPLVLAAIEPLLGLYRGLNNYPYLEAQPINRNPETMRPEELRQLAWPLVAPHEEKTLAADTARFNALAETGLATGDLAKVVAAAYTDQIDRLFVSVDDQAWGTFDEQNWTAEIHDHYRHGDRDLLDLAAVRAFLGGSTIYPCRRHEMPTDSNIAATFRFKA
ncbi:MAG: hypothetical protein P8Y63_01230 [Deltaproteobacteria bacterium]|jgi:hypothetical protein